jgi:tetratricopeptide (TPR) repeat protein
MSEQVLQQLQAGYAAQRAGRLDEAEKTYRRVLTLDRDNVHALNLLGVVCINTGRASEAAPMLERAIRQAPDDADTQSNYGLALKDLGEFDRAARAFEAAARLNPGNPVTYNNLGNVLAAQQRTEEAVAAFRQALQLNPRYAECLSNLAAALRDLGRLPQALAAVDQAITLRPELAEAHNNRGEILLKQARFEEAAACYRAAIHLRSDYVAAMVNLSAALKETGQVEQAKDILEDVLRRDPGNALAYNNLGVLQEQLGDGKGAAASFRRAIGIRPTYAQAWYQLAQLKGQQLTDEEIAAITAQYDDPATKDDERSPLAFALATICEGRRRYDESFRYLQVGQSIKARASPYDDQRVIEYHDSIKRVFSAPLQAAVPVASSGGSRPVFVLGMPRSGTSLTEQILASHPRIAGAGEVSLMEDTVTEAGRLAGQKFPGCWPMLADEQRRQLGEFYLARLVARARAADAADAADWIVDKTPMNFQYIGFIAGILPQARFVHCTRDPVDNCLSIFKLPFEESHSYAHDLFALGRYYTRYLDLMAHWAQIVPGRMIEVRYEDTVADLEGQSRRLLNFLNLPFDPAVLAFHQTERIVKTPSASQVRRPIYSDSVQAWRRYEAHLGPLLEALGMVT